MFPLLEIYHRHCNQRGSWGKPCSLYHSPGRVTFHQNIGLKCQEAVKQVQFLEILHTEDKNRIIPPPHLRDILVEECHMCLQRVGAIRVEAAMQCSYWWPTLTANIHRICKECLACQLLSRVFSYRDWMGGYLVPSTPRLTQSLDYTSTLGQAQETILIIVEDFSKFVVLCILNHLTSASIV